MPRADVPSAVVQKWARDELGITKFDPGLGLKDQSESLLETLKALKAQLPRQKASDPAAW